MYYQQGNEWEGDFTVNVFLKDFISFAGIPWNNIQ